MRLTLHRAFATTGRIRRAARPTALIASLILTALAGSAWATNYYVAVDGLDTNNGSIDHPFATMQQAQTATTAGDTVYIRGGTYHFTEAQVSYVVSGLFDCLTYLDKSGAEGAPINYFAYPGEHPLFDFSAVAPAGRRVVGIYLPSSTSWIHIKGLEMTGVQVTILTHTESYCIYSYGSHCIFENLSLHDNQGTGLRLRTGGYNLVLNCDAYRNHDYTSENTLGGNTDGFGCHPKAGGVGNVFYGCRSWFNSDDGYDVLGAAESVTFDHCWAFYNGYSTTFQSLADGNGFKGGGGDSTADNTIQFCLSVRNKANGFYSNHNHHGSHWLNNSAYLNGNNYNMLNREADPTTSTVDVPGYGHYMRNNLSYSPRGQTIVNVDNALCDIAYNSWDLGVTVTDDDFQSLDQSLLVARRNGDGSLPYTDFMRLKYDSDLIDKGIDIGFPFVGSAPDLGCFEYMLNGIGHWLDYR